MDFEGSNIDIGLDPDPDTDTDTVVSSLDDLHDEAMTEAITESYEQKDTFVRQAIAETDWDETAVIHVVIKYPGNEIPPVSLVWSGHVYRYERRDMGHDYEEHAPCRVYTIDEALCRMADIDPETGEDIAP